MISNAQPNEVEKLRAKNLMLICAVGAEREKNLRASRTMGWVLGGLGITMEEIERCETTEAFQKLVAGRIRPRSSLHGLN